MLIGFILITDRLNKTEENNLQVASGIAIYYGAACKQKNKSFSWIKRENFQEYATLIKQ